jgi:hypothetical protein
MQFKEVILSDLPQDEVLAYNGIDTPRIGTLIRKYGENNNIICIGSNPSIYNVTHYVELDEIKPSEPKISLLEALPNNWIVCKSDNRLEIYRSFRDLEDGMVYDEQINNQTVKEFEHLIVESLL